MVCSWNDLITFSCEILLDKSVDATLNQNQIRRPQSAGKNEICAFLTNVYVMFELTIQNSDNGVIAFSFPLP